MHYSFITAITGKVYMASPIEGRAVLDICAATKNHHDKVPHRLAAHGLTGCDMVGTYFGIGKGGALNILLKGYSLSHLGAEGKCLQEVLSQCTEFILACYSQSKCQTMNEARHRAWASKVSRSTASAPKLPSLPPTDEAFCPNVAPAHFQVYLWKQALNPHPSHLRPTDVGWEVDQNSGDLCPVTVAEGVALAPEELLKLMKCGCKSEMPCSTQWCGCRSSGIVCSIFCGCQEDACRNKGDLNT